jgi:peptide/nickel transport system ATP-binding protein
MTNSALLKVRDLRLRFGNTSVLQGVSFDLQRGEALGLVGESGSGKTTTALSVIQLLAEHAKLSGSIEYRDRSAQTHELIDLPEAKLCKLRGAEIGMVFQDALAALNPVRTIASQLKEVLWVHQRLRGRAASEAMLHWLDRVGIPNAGVIAKRYPHELSGGQRQRILIALALACEPSLLICDEPTSALDVTVQKQVISLLQKLRADSQLSLLFISHDLALTTELCDRIAVMRSGEIVETACSAIVFSAPAHPYTKGLLACRPSAFGNSERLLTVADTEAQALHQTPLPELTQIPQDPAARATELENAPVFLRVEGVSASYPARGLARLWQAPKLAVAPLSFSLKRGECLGIVGESGSGKTTLARCLVRLHASMEGEINLDDIDIAKASGQSLRSLRRRFQMVFQDPYSSLNPALTILQTLQEPLIVHGLHRERSLERVLELLQAVGLPESALARKPREFSGGQRQRIAIARALALEPELLICDESVSALDVSVQAQVLNLLKDLQQKLGLSLIFISHDLSVIRFLADQILVMADGQVVEQGRCEQVFQNPAHVVTRTLLDAIPTGARLVCRVA